MNMTPARIIWAAAFFIGVALLIGTAGASDLFGLPIFKIVIRMAIGIGLTSIGAFGLGNTL